MFVKTHQTVQLRVNFAVFSLNSYVCLHFHKTFLMKSIFFKVFSAFMCNKPSLRVQMQENNVKQGAHWKPAPAEHILTKGLC